MLRERLPFLRGMSDRSMMPSPNNPNSSRIRELWSKVVYGWVETCGVSLLKSSWERRFRQEEHTAHEQRYCGFAGGASTGSRPPYGASALRARRLVEAAVRAEFEEHLSSFGHEKLPDGRQRVVRNGHLPEYKILTGLGEVDVRVPKARSRSGSPEPFRSSVAPPYVRRCASLNAADLLVRRALPVHGQAAQNGADTPRGVVARHLADLDVHVHAAEVARFAAVGEVAQGDERGGLAGLARRVQLFSSSCSLPPSG